LIDFNRSEVLDALTSNTSGTSPALAGTAGRISGAARPLGALLLPPDPVSTPAPKRPPSPGKVRITFEVYEEFAPALRSAIEEISNDIGARLTGSHRFAKEQALTDAAIGLAGLRAAVNAKIPAGDENYV
jgi:hypothetical protein